MVWRSLATHPGAVLCSSCECKFPLSCLCEHQTQVCWQCCNKRINLRSDSILSRRKLTYRQFIDLLYEFSRGSYISEAATTVGLSIPTARSLFNEIRERMAEETINNNTEDRRTGQNRWGWWGQIWQTEIPERTDSSRFLGPGWRGAQVGLHQCIDLSPNFTLQVVSNSTSRFWYLPSLDLHVGTWDVHVISLILSWGLWFASGHRRICDYKFSLPKKLAKSFNFPLRLLPTNHWKYRRCFLTFSLPLIFWCADTQ